MKKFFIIACLVLASCGCPSDNAKATATYEVKFRNGSVVQYNGNRCQAGCNYVKIVNGFDVLLVNFNEVLYVEKIN